mmetsp:Transcript_60599/g.112427  ORF Transcript_60599/g.112427 Transcript_60599/m.112427 type:complete len:239 (-) Transcript_60599:93-809(-)
MAQAKSGVARSRSSAVKAAIPLLLTGIALAMTVQLFQTEAVQFHQAKFRSARVCYNAEAGCVNLVPRGKQRGFPVVEGLRSLAAPHVVAKGNACHVGDYVVFHFTVPTEAEAFQATLKAPALDARADDGEPEDIATFIQDILLMTPERYAPVEHVKDKKEAAYLAYLMTGEDAVDTQVAAPSTPPCPAPATPPAAQAEFPGTPPRRRPRQLIEATPPRVKRVRPSEVATAATPASKKP